MSAGDLHQRPPIDYFIHTAALPGDDQVLSWSTRSACRMVMRRTVTIDPLTVRVLQAHPLGRPRSGW